MAINSSKGGLWSGILIGTAVGCTLSAIVALAITNAPIPFVEKVQKSATPVDASALDGKDPNAALYDSKTRSAAEEALSEIKTVEAPTANRLAEENANSVQNNGTTYRIQAGAFRNEKDAIKVQSDLAFIALEADVVKSTDSGTTLYRVILGPFETAKEANELQQRLSANGFDSMVVRNKQ